jgi:phosphoglycolate phosphatase
LIKAVVFDFDGTLFQFVLDYEGMRNGVKDAVIAAGLPASAFQGGERIRDIVNEMRKYAKANNWTDKKTQRVMDEINRVLDHFEWESAQSNSPADGAKDVLETLKRMGLKTGLLTNNSKRSITYLLKKYSFTKLLDVVVTRSDLGDFNYLKPSSIGLAKVLEKLGIRANEALYVGDSVVDVKAALGVGTKPIFVTTGYSAVDEARKVDPTLTTINRVDQVLGFVTRGKQRD